MLAVVEISAGGFFVGLFLEAVNVINLVFAFGAFGGCGAFYIAELGAGEGGLDAEGNHTVGIGVDEGKGVFDRLLEGFGGLNQLVGGNDGHSGVGVEFREDGGGQPDGAGGIPDDRLGDDIIIGRPVTDSRTISE